MDKVKARLIELVPEIRSVSDVRCGCGVYYCAKNTTNCKRIEINERPITLADVLRAIAKAGTTINIREHGRLWKNDSEGFQPGETWNLALDFDNQTPETRAFIGSLIDVTE